MVSWSFGRKGRPLNFGAAYLVNTMQKEMTPYYRIMVEQMDVYDLWTCIVVLVIAIVFRIFRVHACLTISLILLFVGFVLPLVSSGREVGRNLAINGPAMDNFELLYVYLVFPIYWILMILSLLVVFFLRGRGYKGNSFESEG